jgi:hypothetical protein
MKGYQQDFTVATFLNALFSIGMLLGMTYMPNSLDTNASLGISISLFASIEFVLYIWMMRFWADLYEREHSELKHT